MVNKSCDLTTLWQLHLRGLICMQYKWECTSFLIAALAASVVIIGPQSKESITQTASRSLQPSLQGSQLWQTDRQTDHATRSVTICRTYVRSTVMRPTIVTSMTRCCCWYECCRGTLRKRSRLTGSVVPIKRRQMRPALPCRSIDVSGIGICSFILYFLKLQRRNNVN